MRELAEHENWVAIEWMHCDDLAAMDANSSVLMSIVQTRGKDYGGIKYKVSRGSYVLTKSGKWEYEPLPSSRTAAFLQRCRFDSFLQAVDAVTKTRAARAPQNRGKT